MKIAVLIDSFKLPDWKSKIIEDLSNNYSIELSLLKRNYTGLQKVHNFMTKMRAFLFYLYQYMDYLFFSKTSRFKETKDKKDALSKVVIDKSDYKTFEMQLTKRKLICVKNSFNYEELDFDLILDLTEALNKDFYESLTTISRKGICYFEFRNQPASFPPFFNEIYFRLPTVSSCLSITNGKYKKVLYEACSEIYNISVYLNNDKNSWKMSNFLNRNIDKIKNFSISDFNSKDEALNDNIKLPSTCLMIRFLTKILTNIIRQKLTNIKFKQQWFLAYQRHNNETAFINEDKSNFKIITPPKNNFYADPFIINENDKSYVFFEDYCFLKQKGMISYLEIDKKGSATVPKVILEKDYHLSYPFVFKQDDKYYMIPETLGNKTIELYEATNFPDKWKLNKVLISNINAVDNSLLFYNQKFWLFTTVSSSGSGLSEELCIFYSDSLFGEWKPHSKNPVVSSSKTARCAGKLFFCNGELIRPSQECSLRYGYALNFNKVEVLTENDYKETLIKNIKPEFIDDNLAIHTFNSDNLYNVIDGMKLIQK